MKKEDAYIPLNTEDAEAPSLRYNLFIPENQSVKATVLVLHGMQEHSGRYDDFAQYLSAQGFAVLTYDHLGHGKSISRKNDQGFFHPKEPARQLVKSAILMTEILQKKYPDTPLFIAGHSMGSFVERCVLQQEAHRYKGAIIIGTGDKRPGVFCLKSYFFLANTFFSHRKSWLNPLFNKVNNRKFKKEKNDEGLNWLSANPDNRKAYIEDELCGFDFTNNGFYTLFSLYAQATGKNWAKNIPKTFPCFFISGEDDPIGNFGKGTRKLCQNMKEKGFSDVNLKLYAGMRHEILNENIKQQVYADIKSWLTEHI